MIGRGQEENEIPSAVGEVRVPPTLGDATSTGNTLLLSIVAIGLATVQALSSRPRSRCKKREDSNNTVKVGRS
jgi:hypothetical protein